MEKSKQKELEDRIHNLEGRMNIMEALHGEVLQQLERSKHPQPMLVDVKRREPNQTQG